MFDHILNKFLEYARLRGGLHCSPLAHKKLGTLKDGLVRASFGAFPYIGEITAAVHVFSYIASSATHNREMTRLITDLCVMGYSDDEEQDLDVWNDADFEGVDATEATDAEGGKVRVKR